MMTNKVYLVGAGPGKPDLITVRGLNILRAADVIIYDYLVNQEILAQAKKGAELICCDKLGKKRYADGFLIHQEKINHLLIKKVKEGKRVVRLKNGDPSIFSRCSQELESLVKERIEFEIVPGVMAATAAAGLGGIPLTDRRFASSCIFITGHEDPHKKRSLIDWDSVVKAGSVVLYMALENLDKIVKQMLKAGKDKNTAVGIIQDVSLLTQRVLTGTLKDIVAKAKKAHLKPPAIIIIGEVVKLEKDFNWLKRNKRILFTGLSRERFFLKGTYFHLPLIKIEPLADYTQFDRDLKNIRQFDWIVFTSRYGAEYFFKRLNVIGDDCRVLKDINIAAIGSSTHQRLLDLGIRADLIPHQESSEGLLNAFRKIEIKNKKILLPRSDIADKGLTQGLKDLKAKVTPGIAYRNVMPLDLPDLDLNFFDEIMFTSPSGVRNFIKRYNLLPKQIKVNCIGEVTAREARKWHLLD